MASLQWGRATPLPLQGTYHVRSHVPPVGRPLTLAAAVHEGDHPPSLESSLADAGLDRSQWTASIRQLNGRRNHRIWEPVLDPPALLSHVAVVLVGSKRPSSIGAAARACGCFEVQDLRLVDPRCDYLCRSSRNASKGAQHVLWRATVHQDLRSALAGAAVSVAFARWTKGAHNAFAGMAELLQSPLLADRLGGGAVAGNAGAPLKGKLVLVFGREVRGLDPEEIAACDAVCSIPIGRLQESLSLSHAVSLALAPLFEEGLNQGGGAALASSVADLVAGGEATGDL